MILNELFNAPLATESGEDLVDYFDLREIYDNITTSYKFTILNNTYLVWFDNSQGRIVMEFGLVGEKISDYGQVSPSLTMGLSNTGNSFKVYSTVLNCLRKYLITYKPDKVEFSGYTEKQQNIYKKLSKHQKMPGYTVQYHGIYISVIKD